MKAAERKQAQAVFLAAFRQEANVTVACDEALIDRHTVYDWKERYPDFAKAFEEAEEIANDGIDHEIYRRAVTGWEEPLVSAGKFVCNVRKYSDPMLTLLAKSRMKKYRDKQPDIDLTVQINTMAEQAKNELLADLSAAMTDEDEATTHQS